MNRLTERDDYGNADIIPFSETNPLTAALNKLAAYEDTGLTPAEIVTLKVKMEDSYTEHLDMLCDMKDKQVSALFIENQRLKKLIREIEDILRKDAENANSV